MDIKDMISTYIFTPNRCITNMLRQLNDENLLNSDDILSYIGERFRVKTRLGDHFTYKRTGEYIVRWVCLLFYVVNLQKVKFTENTMIVYYVLL